MQEIYICLDDSGKLSKKEKVSVYGGIVFISKERKDEFINKYRKILNQIKCKYCLKKDNCDRLCPEIKNTNIKPKDKRRIMNYINKYLVIGVVILNNKVYTYIINSKAAKGRFLDYALRRLIKETIKELINKKTLKTNENTKIVINIDQQTTKNNGYYNLKDGIMEELRYGISSFNYGAYIKPIIKSELNIKLSYKDSKKSYVVQAADLIAGTIRRNVIYNKENKILDIKILLP